MTTETNKSNILAILVAILTTAVIVQSYFLYKLYNTNETIETKNTSIDQKLNPTIPQTIRVKPMNLAKRPVHFTQFWDPFEEMTRMHDEVNRLMSYTYSQFEDNLDKHYIESNLKIEEKDKLFLITANIPNTKNDSIKIEIKKNTLHLSGSREEINENHDANGQLIRSTKSSENFARTLLLPKPVKPETLKTEYQDGILRITIEKKPA